MANFCMCFTPWDPSQMAAHPPHSDAGAPNLHMPFFHTTCFRPSIHSGLNNGTLLHCHGCPSSTSIASGAAAAAGLAAHAFCAAGCAGAFLKKPNMLCWLCLALLPACHSLLHFSACSSLLNLLLNSLLRPTTGHHSITDFEMNAFLNQDSYRLLKFVSDLVSIFDTG